MGNILTVCFTGQNQVAEQPKQASTSFSGPPASPPAMPPAQPTPIHLDKDQCMKFILDNFPYKFSEERGAWEFDALPLDPSDSNVEALAGSGFYYFMVPTSIFFGLHPIKLGDSKKWNEKKERDECAFSVFNPAENRYQNEKFVESKATGVILRGGTSYGWASSDIDTSKFPSFLHLWKGDCIIIDSIESIQNALQAGAQAVLDAGTEFPRAHFNGIHWEQLTAMANGEGKTFEALVNAFRAVMQEDPTAKYQLVPRTYAGGVLRITCTLDHLVKSMVPEFNEEMDDRKLPVVTVDEMWGGKTLKYNAKTARTILIGAELANNGQLRYARISFADGPPGEIFYRSVPAAT